MPSLAKQISLLVVTAAVTALTQDEFNPSLQQVGATFQSAAKAIGSNDENVFNDQLQSLVRVMEKLLDTLVDVTSPMSLDSLPSFVSAYTALESGILDYTQQIKVYQTSHPEMDKTTVGKSGLGSIIYSVQKKQFALLPENAPCKFIDAISTASNKAEDSINEVMDSNYATASLPDCVVNSDDDLLESGGPDSSSASSTGKSPVPSLTESEPTALTVTSFMDSETTITDLVSCNVCVSKKSKMTNIISSTLSPTLSKSSLYDTSKTDLNAESTATSVSSGIFRNSSTITQTTDRATTSISTPYSVLPTGPSPAPNTTEHQFTTIVTTAFTTFCPEPTTFCYGDDKCSTVTESTTLTITDCPCTVVVPLETTSTKYGPGQNMTVSVSVPQGEPVPTTELKTQSENTAVPTSGSRNETISQNPSIGTLQPTSGFLNETILQSEGRTAQPTSEHQTATGAQPTSKSQTEGVGSNPPHTKSEIVDHPTSVVNGETFTELTQAPPSGLTESVSTENVLLPGVESETGAGIMPTSEPQAAVSMVPTSEPQPGLDLVPTSTPQGAPQLANKGSKLGSVLAFVLLPLLF